MEKKLQNDLNQKFIKKKKTQKTMYSIVFIRTVHGKILRKKKLMETCTLDL